MLTSEQIAIRSTGIGASEIAAALGLSPYVTPLELYLRKRGEAGSQDDSLPMRFGNAVEPFILSEFQRAHPDMDLVIAPDTMRRGPLLAHLDALVPGRFNVQAKTARSRNGWGESGSSNVPQAYLIQVQAEMLLANVSVSFIPVLFGGADYDEFVVEADAELQDMIESGAHDFWQRVQRGEPPEPVSVADMQARWGRSSRAETAMADADALHAVLNLRDIKAQQQALEAAEEVNKAIVLRAIGECDTLVDSTGKTLATWRTAKPAARFDTALFRSEHPALAAAFTRTGEPSRRFLLKP